MHDAFVQDLIGKGVLYTDAVIAAFEKVRRPDFVHKQMLPDSYADAPLPIGYNQTISQPSTVAIMLEHLRVEPGQRVLEVGCGSGWLTGLLAELVGASGFVYAIDILPEMVDLSEEHLRSYHFENVDVRCADGWHGVPEHAPYNRIIVSAAAEEIPVALLEQLVREGRLVMPVGGDTQDLVVVTKGVDGKIQTEHHPGFQFVPLISRHLHA
jgi:protein-L-isoaspartate(D-aspartate) O-methyltransferase